MKSFQTLYTLFDTLSQNTSSTNVSLGKQLINDQARYLTQKYFDNLQTTTISTVGGMSLTLTGSLNAGATSAILSSVWTYPTVTQLVNFSNGQSQMTLFTNNSATITWGVGLTSIATSAISTPGAQTYTIPANISKIKDVTISVGQLQFVPIPVMSDVEWKRLNFLPYASDIPNYYYMFGNTLSIFPIPSTTGNTITFTYKRNVSDMTYDDYSTPGTFAASGMVIGSTSVIGSGTTWASTYPTGVDLTYANLFINALPPGGDGQYYQIANFTDNTHLTLVEPIVNAPNITGALMVIGQYPLLQGDFHDMLIHKALMVYFSSIKKDPEQFKLFQGLYTERLGLLEDYLSTTEVNVDLGSGYNYPNPNLFLYAPNSNS